jgi:hypothetical protein
MRNIKIEKSFVGHDYWPGVAFLDVKGKPEAKDFPKDGTEEEMEKVIQSWKDIAVLKVSPKIQFKFGYVQGNAFHYLKETIEVNDDGKFAVRVGDNDIRFFVLPSSLDCDLKLELVEQTKENDKKYKDLPLY